MRSITRRAFFLRIFRRTISAKYVFLSLHWLGYNKFLKHVFRFYKSLNYLQRVLGMNAHYSSIVLRQQSDIYRLFSRETRFRDIHKFSARSITIIYLVLRGRYHRGDFHVRGEYLRANFDLLHGRAAHFVPDETRWAIQRRSQISAVCRGFDNAVTYATLCKISRDPLAILSR